MSRFVRCRECPEGRRPTFDALDHDLPLHIALEAHNAFEALDPSTGEWEPVGPYLGAGYFGVDS